ncbi:hypothetical protein BGZ63DRAFT_84309 [Mariannaea sp. PMI_226]|nr:hypothetical protein BGZ63DRAFT_84309 [Mariannaea sp. PMI_226]
MRRMEAQDKRLETSKLTRRLVGREGGGVALEYFFFAPSGALGLWFLRSHGGIRNYLYGSLLWTREKEAGRKGSCFARHGLVGAVSVLGTPLHSPEKRVSLLCCRAVRLWDGLVAASILPYFIQSDLLRKWNPMDPLGCLRAPNFPPGQHPNHQHLLRITQQTTKILIAW